MHKMARIDSDDTAAVLQELGRRKDEDDVDHFHAHEVDALGRLTRLFWADADVRVDSYGHSDDVVVVDTSCRTNKYGVPFVPFVGMNHHRRPVLLGCGVVTDQSLDSFVWLLRSYLLSTCQQRPRSVITDGCDAVIAAVRIVLPQCNHRICSWHVERGVTENLFCPSSQNEFRSLMMRAAAANEEEEDVACSPAEFEERWHAFLASWRRTVMNQEWLHGMYMKRALWAAAFVRDKFFVGMASDQRTECLGTPLHAGLQEGMSLLDLLRHADACTEDMRACEADLDHEADASRQELTTQHPLLERDAAQSFTPANFRILRKEIEALDDLEILHTLTSGGADKVYTVGSESRWGGLFSVEWCHDRSGIGIGGDAENKKMQLSVRCVCRKMERDGLPCRHILRVLVHEGKPSIPECCKLRRLLRRSDTRAQRLEEMEELGRQVFDLASQDAEEFEEIKQFLEGWLEEKR